ncbi:MAG: prolyl oligopeptidase family serine peptidase, partial [Candidatus Thermoplasmatota archaeon]|nr:prolyl oligopeptidase family serine peptidase [Candidatus Thermoplasmatota archaeon]
FSVIRNTHFESVDGRFFLWIQPQVDPGSDGYPVLFLFHGASQHAFSWIFGINKWSRNQMGFARQALDAGFVLILLQSQRPVRLGPRAWDVFEQDSTINKDIAYVNSIISWIKETKADVMDVNTLFATGFSSGAFMCSRIALSSEQLFNAIALHSGCNADSITLTDRGPVFNFTYSHNISINHPPTLIVHGEQDQIVPVEGGKTYHDDLKKAGIQTDILLSEEGGHIWLSEFNDEILLWFQSHMN